MSLSRAARLDDYWVATLSGRECQMAAIQTLRTQYRVSDFVEWQKAGTLELNPNFQRRPVWKKGAKSFLIDTILRGLPMPIIFLRDLRSDLKTLKARRDVVDGQQRIRTILGYIDRDLLVDFKTEHDEFVIDPVHNKDLGGKAFKDLDSTHKQQILDYQFSVHSFPADTDDRDLLQIFARMNATGVKLNAQELRNAEFFGAFKTLAYQIATEQLNRWRDDWHIFTPLQIARMNEVEMTSEFMLLIMDGVLEKNNKTIDAYYKEYDGRFGDAKEVANRFRSTLDAIETLLPKDVVSGLFRNRTLFYALFASIYGLQYDIRPTPNKVPASDKHALLSRKKPIAVKGNIIDHLKRSALAIKNKTAPADVLEVLRGSTAHAGGRRTIIKYLVGRDNDPCPPLR
jgi:hypothetical protein